MQLDIFQSFKELFADSEDVKAFLVYHAENPDIYKSFKQITFEAIAKGYQRWSSSGVFEVVRWNTMVKGNDGYKINNNFKPFYSRLFVYEYPQHKDFFKFRCSMAEGVNYNKVNINNVLR